MKVFKGTDLAPGGEARRTLDSGSAVTIGNFDGIHLGHIKILERLKQRARELDVPAVVMTFDPHPRKVLSHPSRMPLITDNKTKCGIFSSLDLDYLVIVSFTPEFAAQSPLNFIEWWLMPMSPKAVVIGYDFNFGRGGAGSFDLLKTEGLERGFSVEMVDAHRVEDMTVSSSRIRNLIEGGEVSLAEKLLGRPYSLRGHVVKGHGRGRKLGIPTANVDSGAELIPCDGVYAGEVVVGARVLPAMVNIGTNPTFDDIARSVEACILDFDEDIYNMEVEVRFRDRVRSEIKFPDADALIARIDEDRKIIRAFFRKHDTSPIFPIPPSCP